MSKVINQITKLQLVHLERLNQHIQAENNNGWELFNIAQQSIGINEFMLLLWRKTVNE